MKSLKRHPHGFTVVEAIISSAFISLVIWSLPGIFKQISRANLLQTRAEGQYSADAVSDVLLMDLKTANFSSVLNVFPVQPATTTNISWFAKDIYNGDTRQTSWIEYRYDNQNKILWRDLSTAVDPTTDKNVISTILMTNVVPSFSLESSTSTMVLFSLIYTPASISSSNNAPIVVNRRAAVRG